MQAWKPGFYVGGPAYGGRIELTVESCLLLSIHAEVDVECLSFALPCILTQGLPMYPCSHEIESTGEMCLCLDSFI